MHAAAGSRPARAPVVVRALWVLGFGVGTVSHAVDIAAAGLDVYAGSPAPVRLFWVALLLLDPAVIALVLMRRRTGWCSAWP